MPPLLKQDPTHAFFGGVDETPVEKSERRDRFMKAVNNIAWGQFGRRGERVGGSLSLGQYEDLPDGQKLIKLEKFESASDRLASLLRDDTINKALGADQIAGIQQALSQAGDIQKDISLTSPVPTGLTLYDLKPVAEELVPVDTPIRNRFPRTQGYGTAFHYKQITGFSNAQTGTGLPLIHPGITDTTQNNFAVSGSANTLYLNRGPKISYTGQDVTASYFQFGLSDEVTWSAAFAAQGFTDPRSLSHTSTLFASFLAEERMSVYGRSSATGYSGALTAPTTVTATPQTTGGNLAAGTTYHVWVAAVSGFGTTAATDSGAITTTGTTGSIQVYWTPVAGAVGYQVFFGSSAGAVNAFFVSTVGNNGTASAPAITLVGPVPSSGATAPTVNTSAQANGYDGILPIVLSANAGYNANVNGKLSTTNPGAEFQTAFAAMYALNLANPDFMLFNGTDRKQLSDTIKSVGNPNGYRITLDVDNRSGRVLGEIVTGMQNEVTGKEVDLDVHPYMPQGVVPILTEQLPFPNSNIPACWEYRNVQDMMGVDWPQIQFSYDYSTYWFGTFFCHAPAWQGAVYGIVAA
jgi:hypothetical protein